VTPVSYPEIWDVKMELSGTLTFKAKTDSEPEFELANYKGIKVKRDKVSIGDKEVDEALSSVKNMFAEFLEVDHEIRKGDFGICDVDTTIDGKSVATKRQNMFIEADKEKSLLGVGEELCGLKIGEKKDIPVDLPVNYPDKKFAGKKALLSVEVKGVKEKKLPELNDELAKKLGKEKIEDLRVEIKDRILAGKEEGTKTAMKDQIVEYLLKKHSFDLPPTMVKRQLSVLISKTEDELTQRGLEKKDIESHVEEMKKKLGEDANDKVKLYFVLDKIASKEEISVSDEDTDEWLKALASSLNRPYDNVRRYYEEHDLLGGLNEQLREEKTLAFLLEEASVTEK
jgi:trigger factor